MPRCLASHVIISHIASGGAHVRRGLKGGEQMQFITSQSFIEDSEEVKWSFLRLWTSSASSSTAPFAPTARSTAKRLGSVGKKEHKRCLFLDYRILRWICFLCRLVIGGTLWIVRARRNTISTRWLLLSTFDQVQLWNCLHPRTTSELTRPRLQFNNPPPSPVRAQAQVRTRLKTR